MKKLKLITGIVMIFILGVLTGVLGTGHYLKKHYFGFLEKPASRTAFIVNRLDRKLDLDPAQKEKINTLVGDTMKKAQGQFNVHRKQMAELIDGLTASIRKELTPAQQEKFDRMVEQLKKRRPGFRSEG